MTTDKIFMNEVVFNLGGKSCLDSLGGYVSVNGNELTIGVTTHNLSGVTEIVITSINDTTYDVVMYSEARVTDRREIPKNTLKKNIAWVTGLLNY